MNIMDKITSFLTGQLFPFTKKKNNVLIKFEFFAMDVNGDIKKNVKYKVWAAVKNYIHLN